MVTEQFSKKKNKNLIKGVIQQVVKRKGYSDIRAKVDGYELPTRMRRKDDSVECVPDISAKKNGRKSYFEIALKPKKNGLRQRIVSKWKLLQTLAKMRSGKLFLIAPRGNYAFVKRTMDKYNIDAEVVKYN